VKYYIIAGEASGDLHGANLLKALIAQDANAQFRLWGGDKMADVAGAPVKHIQDLAFMGFLEVLLNLKTILGNLKFCKKDLLAFQPDVLILIDYPGFNMRIAEFAKSKGIKVVYYISPQIWAWKQKRAYKLKKTVDRMLVILPFEKDFYRKFGMTVDFVGHPLLDEISRFKPKTIPNVPEKMVLLLPGSRKQEVAEMLPVMVKAARRFPELNPVIAAAPNLDPIWLRQIANDADVQVVAGHTYSLMQKAHVALVTSGTATLETALWNTPMVVCYKGSTLSYWIARQLVKIKYISLVNLILDKPVVEELIQHQFHEKQVILSLQKLIQGPEREKQLQSFAELRNLLGGEGASERAAKIINDVLKA
jgi:lipid-A-disaccharide synthase